MDGKAPHRPDLKKTVSSSSRSRIPCWNLIVFSIALLGSGLTACSDNSSEPDGNPTKMILQLGGNDCEFYLGAVEAAIKELSGIQEVDLSTQRGHAIVKTDGTLSTSQVVNAVDGLSGDGWHCEAELKH